MAITKTTTTGYGKRLTSSISGIVIGLILFVTSFGVLYWNEGKTDISNIAKTAVTVDAATENTDATLNGKLVSIYGDFKTDETIGDGLYLNPGNYLALERVVEMYAWREKSESTTKENVGGSETTTTTYSYEQGWTSSPQDSSGFEEAGHTNPAMGLKGESFKAKSVKIGQYDVDFGSVRLPGLDDLKLKLEIIKLDPATTTVQGDHVYKPVSAINPQIPYNPNAPQIGDLRISYRYLPSGITGTIFGALQGKRVTSFADAKGNTLFRIFTTTKELAINQMHTEFITSRWIWRVVGFLMMWFGLTSILGIVSMILAVVPFLASVSRSIIGVITFIIALIFTAITIIVSQILHSWVALIVVVILAVAAIFLVPKLLKKKQKPATPAA